MTSQFGEDGILKQALSLLPEHSRWCIEFGAWDGKHLSNTFSLVDSQHYQVVLIEGDQYRFQQLCRQYPYPDRATFLNAYVGWSQGSRLEDLLRTLPVPPCPDLLSIDIDGNDYHVWSTVTDLRPKLVLIEYNPSISNYVEFVQPRDRSCNQGSSAAALVRLAKEKAYELVAVTAANLLFVDGSYYDRFRIPDNSLELMRDERGNHIFFGFDGTVFLHGDGLLPWHGVRLSPEQLQVLPPLLRRYPPTCGVLRRCALEGLRILGAPSSEVRRVSRYVRKRLGLRS